MERQVFINLTDADPFNRDDWYENALGNIIRPIVLKFNSVFDWFWFSQYNPPKQVKFRYSLPAYMYKEIEEEISEIARSMGATTVFDDFNSFEELTTPRHIGEPRTEARRRIRSNLITDFYYRTALLTLDILTNSGYTEKGYHQFQMEVNDDPDHQLPAPKSPFSVPHHLFCNMTHIQLHAQIKIDLKGLQTKNLRVELGTGYNGNTHWESDDNTVNQSIHDVSVGIWH